ncbi:uncharacterized protein LOC111870514 [Cryptotermes secundus]|uniref:uncharacterized protein LOC111870514 n=1 Tax=Cryptotermes secundus TaxID=105785 RepID=UPI000CD7CC34|nr:uncharacterized protein LOC111870514 [Cryptotermes secundus]
MSRLKSGYEFGRLSTEPPPDSGFCVVVGNEPLACQELLQWNELAISYGNVYDIVHDSLGYCKVSCRWVPKLLDDLNKAKRMMMSLQHLQHYSEEGERFLDLTVIRDEMWVLHFTPESKQQSMVWKHPGSRVMKKFHRMPSIGNLMVTVFWDHRGPLLLFIPRGATINADSYCGTLTRL